MVFGLIAIVVFIILFAKNNFKDKRTFWFSLGVSMLIAGSVGNSIDRYVLGYVIDFIDFKGFGSLWTYVFNFADVYLTIGLVLLFIDVFFLEQKRAKKNV